MRITHPRRAKARLLLIAAGGVAAALYIHVPHANATSYHADPVNPSQCAVWTTTAACQANTYVPPNYYNGPNLPNGARPGDTWGPNGVYQPCVWALHNC